MCMWCWVPFSSARHFTRRILLPIFKRLQYTREPLEKMWKLARVVKTVSSKNKSEYLHALRWKREWLGTTSAETSLTQASWKCWSWTWHFNSSSSSSWQWWAIFNTEVSHAACGSSENAAGPQAGFPNHLLWFCFQMRPEFRPSRRHVPPNAGQAIWPSRMAHAPAHHACRTQPRSWCFSASALGGCSSPTHNAARPHLTVCPAGPTPPSRSAPPESCTSHCRELGGKPRPPSRKAVKPSATPLFTHHPFAEASCQTTKCSSSWPLPTHRLCSGSPSIPMPLGVPTASPTLRAACPALRRTFAETVVRWCSQADRISLWTVWISGSGCLGWLPGPTLPLPFVFDAHARGLGRLRPSSRFLALDSMPPPAVH